MNARVLIVEDDRSIAELERDYLEAAGFGVKIAPDGESGLREATSGDYDLIILDVMLPGHDGFSIAEAVRSALDVPILMVSARQDDADKIRGLGLGADDYITKPFSPGELVARVKVNVSRYRTLTAKRPRSSDEIVSGRLRIDLRSLRAFNGTSEIALTAKEMTMLRLFMENPDTVLTKAEIYESVWGEAHHGDITTVTVHVRKLREKIEDDPGSPKLLETVWGMGYRFASSPR